MGNVSILSEFKKVSIYQFFENLMNTCINDCLFVNKTCLYSNENDVIKNEKIEFYINTRDRTIFNLNDNIGLSLYALWKKVRAGPKNN